MDLLEFAKMQFEPAQQMIRMGSDNIPTLIFLTADGKPGIAAVPDFGKPGAKPVMHMMMRRLLKEQGAIMYAFVMEAWMGTQEKGKLKLGYRPSKDPDRTESICIAAADADGNKVFVHSVINRTPTLSFGEPESMPIVSAPLLELLEEPSQQSVH